MAFPSLTAGEVKANFLEYMRDEHVETIAAELGLPVRAVAGALALLEEGATVPFMARYRKERTGEMDEETIRALRDRSGALAALDDRRRAILKSLQERDLLTKDLEQRLRKAATLSAVEDIYLPYRPKRKTRASKAREQGLEPLADALLKTHLPRPIGAAEKFVNPEMGIESAEDALAGARDIIAEMINEDPEVRARLRGLFEERAMISSSLKAKSKAAEAQVYRDYFDWSESTRKTQAHRTHAVLRGEREGYLTVHIEPNREDALGVIEGLYLRHGGEQARQLAEACDDAYRRLLKPSLEGELKSVLKDQADRTALAVFTSNLRDLLLSPPLGEKAVMGVDPGFRTGCKVVCLDPRGNLICNTTIYPLEPQGRSEEAAVELRRLMDEHGTEVVAVGNGTGGREAEKFLRGVVAERSLPVVSVSEAGASVYSASEAAREEFPDHDITVRGAVSIARRLMDPLSELVKIDPKSIGVGQYQHDVDQKLLESGLTDTVVSCVNSVGVELNTASAWLLSYVSGLSRRNALAIVEHRRKHGAFTGREQLSSVKGIGEKSFQQAAGFLRIKNGPNPLDASAVHPERYALVGRMAEALGTKLEDLIGNSEMAKRLDLRAFADDEIGLPSLRDIQAELGKPGRDPRSEFEVFAFSEDVHDVSDLKKGMKLPGLVTNVTNFGAFVDIGVHCDGLIHISKLADRYVSDPKEIVRVNQRVEVTVIEVDNDRQRISLSLID